MSSISPEALVEYLDLASFFLVTPEIVGRERIDHLYKITRAYVGWMYLQFGNETASPAPVNAWIALKTMLYSGIAALVYGGFGYWFSKLYIPHPSWRWAIVFVLVVLAIALLMVTVSVLGCLLVILTRNNNLSKILLFIGACVFVAARVLAIRHASGRSP